ncbi:hypothetical protein [Sphingomonas sp.]|uniref:hypothetical protein n=1 Tax=Sphingomonas sp. TaxID=28214 RepID=UPI00286E54CD|nr:hypothetical protein [Sphingomonas sp.]
MARLFPPPARLRALPERTAKWLRWLWMLCFGLAILVVIVSTIYAWRASYSYQPTIERHGLDFEVSTDGELTVGTAPGATPAIPVTAEVVAIDGQRIAPGLEFAELAERLAKAPGPVVAVTLRQTDGRTVTLSQARRELRHPAELKQAREARIWARMVTALMACTALLACSCLIALRRPTDPVAMLLAFAFAGLAATVDPPLQFWLWTNQAIVLDVVGVVVFYCLLLALASFPDGVFVPRYLRWLVPLGLPLAVLASAPGIDEDVQGILAISLLLAVLASQIIRFRREPAGIARQQIKWAGFGFAIGLLLIMAAVVLAALQGDDPSRYTPLISVIILVLFSMGMATIPLGLLIALTRFRLWEADTVISRSAAYAVVTLVVGVVWAASADLVKLIIAEVMGSSSEAGATTVGAIIAAGIFAPTQNVVLGWTERRFGGPVERVAGAAQRLKKWGLTEVPHELASRALGCVEEIIHPAAAAIVLDNGETLATHGTASSEDPALSERIVLTDEEGPVGTLLLGRRSDGNRYNRHELEAAQLLAPAIADALRVARSRHSREAMLQDRLEEMAARLAQLEGGAPKPA